MKIEFDQINGVLLGLVFLGASVVTEIGAFDRDRKTRRHLELSSDYSTDSTESRLFQNVKLIDHH